MIVRNRSIFFFAVLAGSTYADVSVTAPGMVTVYQAQGTEIQETIQLGHYWRYEVTGYEYRLVAGKPTDGYINSGGNLKSQNGSPYLGHSLLKASAGSSVILGQVDFHTNHYLSSKSDEAVLANPIVFENENVSISVQQTSNMLNDRGSFLVLQGVAMKQPPVPTGDLEIPHLVREGATPEVTWVIRREGSMGITPALPSEVISWSPTVTPGVTPPFIDMEDEDGVVTDPDGDESSDTPNAGKNKTNNGHGNNADGVDVSNPGKSAEKWNDKWGIIDQSGSYDDESNGGGSAVSKNKK